MTVLSAPSELHESLQRDLQTVAVLAGYPLHMPLEAALIPDVVQTDILRSGLFVGDAKATERPSNPATADRLLAYARMVACWWRFGLDFRFAIAHADATDDWGALLEQCCATAGLPTSSPRRDAVSESMSITWLGPMLSGSFDKLGGSIDWG